MLDRFGVTPSVALGAAAAKRYPELVDELVRRNACFLAHGTYATRRITSRMSEAEERAFIAESRDAVRAAAGDGAARLVRPGLQRIRSHAGAAGRGRLHLHHRLGERRSAVPAGPYRRSLVALPPQPEWNDLECMWLRRVSPPVWADNIAEAFAFLHDEGGASFNLTLHPWIAGQAHRIRWLREALSRVLGRGQIWRTTTDEVARVAREQL